jgi:hypothetical protein
MLLFRWRIYHITYSNCWNTRFVWINGVNNSGRSVKLLLALASRVNLSFGTPRDLWPYFVLSKSITIFKMEPLLNEGSGLTTTGHPPLLGGNSSGHSLTIWPSLHTHSLTLSLTCHSQIIFFRFFSFSYSTEDQVENTLWYYGIAVEVFCGAGDSFRMLTQVFKSVLNPSTHLLNLLRLSVSLSRGSNPDPFELH